MVYNKDDNYCISTSWINENGIKNKGLWYFYHLKMKERIKNYQKIWNCIIKNKQILASCDKTKEYYASLLEQYVYLLFNLDQILKIEENSIPDNDDVFLMTYFTYNYVLSAKSIIDIFAWLINDIFACECKLSEVSLIFKSYDRPKEKHRTFKNKLKEKAESNFVNHICSDNVQFALSNLEQHRDIICHRGKIHIMIKNDRDNRTSTIVKPIDPHMFKGADGFNLWKQSAGIRYDEKCSEFSKNILKILDDVFLRINECLLSQITKER